MIQNVNTEYNGAKFRCTITDKSGATVISKEVTLTVKPKITTQPVDYMGPIGSTATFTVAATAGQDCNVSYQWQRENEEGKFEDWSERTNASVSMPVGENDDGKRFRCVIKGGFRSSVTSNVVTLTGMSINITKQPVDRTVALGKSAKFNVEVEGEGLTYQWQVKARDAEEFTNAESTSSNLTVYAKDWRDGYQYRCVVSDGNDHSVTSDAATLNIRKPYITKQPADTRVALDKSAKFTVAARGEGLTYQWQEKGLNAETFVNSTLKGCDTNTLTVYAKNWRYGYQYRCVVTDGEGASVTSEAATLTIKPYITKQPADRTATLGAGAKFVVTAKGENLTYQWQQKSLKAETFADITLRGYNTNALTVYAKTWRNGYQYRCVITDDKGNTVTSDAATLTVEGVSITTQPADVSIAKGASAKFVVAAEGNGLTYQWQVKGRNAEDFVDMENQTTRKLSVYGKTWRNGYQYRCVVSDGNGHSETSDAATLTVTAAE